MPDSSSDLNIIFMGSPDFAVPSLRILHQSNHRIAAVVTGTDKVRSRGTKTEPTPVKKQALTLGLPLVETDNLKDPSLADILAGFGPDLFVVVAFRLLPPALLAVPRLGSVNLHASLLPKYRGAAPIHHAVMNGEIETGCTVFFLDERMDTGSIILQSRIAIGPDETTGSVYQRLMHSGAQDLLDAVNRIASGTCTLQQQDDRQATPAPKLFKQDGKINFNQPASRVHNFIRGLNPSPGAFTQLDGKMLRIHKVRPVTEEFGTAGQLFRNGAAFISCATGSVELLEIQLEGKKSMPAADFFNGWHGPGIIS